MCSQPPKFAQTALCNSPHGKQAWCTFRCCLTDLRDSRQYLGIRTRIAAGAIIVTVCFTAIVAGVVLKTFSGANAAPESGPTGSRCSEDVVEAGVRGFLSATRRGDPVAVNVAVADQHAFRVYSEGLNYGSKRPDKFFMTQHRQVLVRHLLNRHAKGDRMWFRTFEAHGFDRQFDICNFEFTILRRIAGGPRRPFIGKGALDAPTGRVAVWNIGAEIASGRPRSARPGGARLDEMG